MTLEQRLHSIYDRLPRTDCTRCLDCCRVSPPVTYAETKRLDSIVSSMPDDQRHKFFNETIRTELLGRLILVGVCPFLAEGGCSIHRERPFACRQFGLTSAGEYENILKRRRVQD